MKQIWLAVVFFLVYGLFSMKSQAAEKPLSMDGALSWEGSRWILPCQGG